MDTTKHAVRDKMGKAGMGKRGKLCGKTWYVEVDKAGNIVRAWTSSVYYYPRGIEDKEIKPAAWMKRNLAHVLAQRGNRYTFVPKVVL